MRIGVLTIFLFCVSFHIAYGQLIINEVSTTNTVYLDEFGESSDWVELYNPTDSIVFLDNYYLTDDIGALFKYQIGNSFVLPKDYKIVFCSDRNIKSDQLLPRRQGGIFKKDISLKADLSKGVSFEKIGVTPFLGIVSRDTVVSVRYKFVDDVSLNHKAGIFLRCSEKGVPLKDYNNFYIRGDFEKESEFEVDFLNEQNEFVYSTLLRPQKDGLQLLNSPIFFSDKNQLDLVSKLFIRPCSKKDSVDFEFVDLYFERDSLLKLGVEFFLNDDQEINDSFMVDSNNEMFVRIAESLLLDSDIEFELKKYHNEIIESNYTALFLKAKIDSGVVVNVELENSSDFLVEGTGKEELYPILFFDEEGGLEEIIFSLYKGKGEIDFYGILFSQDLGPLEIQNLHSPFKLSSKGEIILLFNGNKELVDEIDVPLLETDISYGRMDSGELKYFENPTPNQMNDSLGFNGYCYKSLSFNQSSGFYDSAILLEMKGASSIRYTLDGSIPSLTDSLYKTPVLIEHGTVVRMGCFENDKKSKDITTSTFFVGLSTDLPVFSISTDPDNLFDQEIGIYSFGLKASSSFPYYGANFWRDWEIPVSIELFESNKKRVLQENCGLKIFGGTSRGLPKKSLSFHFRKDYGVGKLNYPLLAEYPELNEFNSFILRTSSGDWQKLLFRDAFNQSLLNGSGVDYQKYRPSVLFLNGEYWGIYNIREKSNEDYFAENYGIEPDSVDMGALFYEVENGDITDFKTLIERLGNQSISYEEIQNEMDVLNFARYMAFEIYICNTDWPWNNIKYWRSKELDNKWRWLVYDTDLSTMTSVTGRSHYTADIFDVVYNYVPGVSSGKAEIPSVLFNSMLAFPDFRKLFVTEYLDFMNDRFSSKKVITEIDAFSAVIGSEIPANHKRWSTKVSDWTTEIDSFKVFWENRGEYARLNMKKHLSLGSEEILNLIIEPNASGVVKLNSFYVSDSLWSGVYFDDYPVYCKARANSGYRFKYFMIGDSVIFGDSIMFIPNSLDSIHVVFEQIGGEGQLIVSEINYNDGELVNTGDWIEFSNVGDAPIDISGWMFRDNNLFNGYVFPSSSIIQPNQSIVLVNDLEKFSSFYGSSVTVFGVFEFSLDNSGDRISLYNDQQYKVFSFVYDDEYPWPMEADGKGYTLNYNYVNGEEGNYADPLSWAISCFGGSPGVLFGGCDVLGSNKVQSLKFEHVFPNPTSNYLTVELIEDNPVTLLLISAQGNIVLEKTNQTTNVIQLDLHNINEGLYFLKIIKQNNSDSVHQIIIQH